MKLIVGLGNPGRLYLGSRHNIGFRLVKDLARSYRGSFKKEDKLAALVTKVKIGGEPVLLALPFTFMNLSGIAVSALLKKYRLSPDSLLVVSDDLDLDLGRFKLKSGGSSGGHRGLESVIDVLKSRNFNRLRLGIGRPPVEVDPVDYVLEAFTKKENEILRQVIDQAVVCCQSWITKGINETMNIFNKRSN